MTTLTSEQIKRQDQIDNMIQDLIIRSAPAEKRDSIDWDEDNIALIRDELGWIVCNHLHLMTWKDFYPDGIE